MNYLYLSVGLWLSAHRTVMSFAESQPGLNWKDGYFDGEAAVTGL